MPGDFVSGLILAVILVLACQIPWLAFLALRSDAGDGGDGGTGDDPGRPESPDGGLLVTLPEAGDPIDADYLEELWKLPAAEDVQEAPVPAGAPEASAEPSTDPSADRLSQRAREAARESIRREVATNPYRYWVIGPGSGG